MSTNTLTTLAEIHPPRWKLYCQIMHHLVGQVESLEPVQASLWAQEAALDETTAKAPLEFLKDHMSDARKRFAALHYAPAEKLARAYCDDAGGPAITWGQQVHCPMYVADMDTVHMPVRCAYKTASLLYGAWFHELAHSTGQKHRLNRPGFDAKPGNENDLQTYASEEVFAELASLFISAEIGLVDGARWHDSASYLWSWTVRLDGPGAMERIANDALETAMAAACWLLGAAGFDWKKAPAPAFEAIGDAADAK